MNATLTRHGSALLVLLATLGCAPQRPAHPQAALEALRRPFGPGLSALVAGVPGGPRVILVHGTPGSAAGWADYLLDPPPGLELIALDRPGFGRSAPEGPVTRLAAQAEAVAALLPADGRGVVLVGHSLGGAIVARVAAEHPQQVVALVLVASSLDPALEKIHPLQPIGAWPPLRALLPRAIRNANAELLALQSELAELAALLPRIRVPVRIVHGTADELVPVANVAYLQRHLAGARCVDTVLLPGADHFLPWNAAERVRAAIDWALNVKDGSTC